MGLKWCLMSQVYLSGPKALGTMPKSGRMPKFKLGLPRVQWGVR